MTPPRITRHVIDRYRERVDACASVTEANMAIQQILALGRWRVTPRSWMSENQPAPGVRFVYWAKRPRLCVVIVDGAAVTVVTRSLARSTRERRFSVVVGHDRRAPRARLEPVDRWRWNRDLGEAA
jgi:hypothetical protein